MPNRETVNTSQSFNAFDVQLIQSDTATNGEIIDTQGYDAFRFVIQAGTITLGTIATILQEGDDSGLSDASTVATADLVYPTGETDANFAATDDNKVKIVGYVGGKRYLRIVLTTAASADLTVGVVALGEYPSNAAVAANSQ